MKRNVIICIVIPLLCVCCKNLTTSSVDVLEEFPELIELNAKDTVMTHLIDPSGILVTDSLFVISQPGGSPMISLYDLSGRCLQSFLHRGRGPGETTNLLRTSLHSPSSIQVSVASERVYIYDIESLLNGNLLPKSTYKLPGNTYAFPSISMVSDNDFLYVGKNLPEDQSGERRFCIYHENTDKVESFGAFPEEDRSIEEFPKDDFSRHTAYQGIPILSPDRTKAVVIYFYAVGLDILDLEEYQIDTSVFYQYPQVESVKIPELDVYVVRRIPESLRGFIDCWCNNEHIYVLYSGKKFTDTSYSTGNYILKYDWMGMPLCIYKLDQSTSCFTIDNDETFIYAVVQDETSSSIMRYEMPLSLEG